MNLQREVLWKHLWNTGGTGLEHLLQRTHDADSVIIWTDEEGHPRRLTYTVEWDAEGRTRRFSAQVDGSMQANTLELTSDGSGSWRMGNENISALDGCLDLDLWPTPFTNSLPIRRLDLRPGATETVRCVFVAAPGLEVSVKEQRYTNLGNDRYRFESVEDGFTAELIIDENGLVISYPELFERIA